MKIVSHIAEKYFDGRKTVSNVELNSLNGRMTTNDHKIVIFKYILGQIWTEEKNVGVNLNIFVIAARDVRYYDIRTRF